MEKKIIKRTTAVLLTTMILGGYHSVNASAVENSSIDKQQTSGYMDVNTNATSKVMTFDQIVDEMAKNENLTKKEAVDSIISSFSQDNTSTKARSMSPEMQARSATYRTMSSQFTVKTAYKPTLAFYCQTDESGNFRAIKKILKVSMNRSYNGISKQFGGSVYTNLEDPNRIYWMVNGDFYNNGTTTVNGSVSISVGGSAEVAFGVSSASNHYSYAYKTGYYNF